MKRLLLSATVAGALLAAASAQAATYVAYDSFDIVGGGIPASAFTFGRTTGAFTGSITGFTNFDASCGDANIECARTGNTVISKAQTYTAGVYDPYGTNWWVENFLTLHGDENGGKAAVQFTAPTAGDYNFNGRFQAQDQYPTGVDLGVYIGTYSWISTSLYGGGYDVGFTSSLAAGDKVTFIMGPGSDWSYDSTGFRLQVNGPDVPVISGVPEPASWAMMILGVGLAGSALRSARRRQILA